MNAYYPRTAQAPAPALTDEQKQKQKRIADSHLNALLRYTGEFYESAIEHGMKRAETSNAVAHVERAARSLHEMALLAAASPTPTEDARLAKELLRAKNLIRCLWDAYPEARKDIEANTGAWFVWGADRDATQTKGETP
jgi:hypothetical protein